MEKDYIKIIEYLEPKDKLESFLITGPSGCGKTLFTIKYLEENFKNNDIFWYYTASKKPKFKNTKLNITLKESTYNYTDEFTKNACVVFDDCMTCINKDLINLFVRDRRHSHHVNLFLLVQNTFSDGLRTISLNVTKMVIFKWPRCQQQIRTLAQQMGCFNTKFIISSYCIATKNPYSYLFIDFSQEVPDILRLQTNVLAADGLRRNVFVKNE